jgi:hypothetical protein
MDDEFAAGPNLTIVAAQGNADYDFGLSVLFGF